MKKYTAKIIIVLLSTLFTFELGSRIVNMDMILIKPLLYYQTGDLYLHRVSDNPELLYELAPNKSLDYVKMLITINNLGFRDRKRGKEKEKGVFRIICFGGSNTFGVSVNDNQTYTYYLEELLNKRTKKKYEVWNAGCCAYSQAQDVEVAKKMEKEYSPDLLIFQRTNDRRRAFLYNTDYTHFFRRNPSLYWENVRYIPAVNSSFGRWIFLNSYMYRSLILLINRINTTLTNNILFNDGIHYNSELCENEKRLVRFYQETNPRIPVLVWQWNKNQYMNYGAVKINTINVFNPVYYPANMPKEYFEIHPPFYVYKWYAESLFKELKRKHLI
jgi:hypothetical protein